LSTERVSRFEDVLTKILAGQILSFRHPEKSGIAATYVDATSVKHMKISP